jgi:hypothetical protein
MAICGVESLDVLKNDLSVGEHVKIPVGLKQYTDLKTT